MPVIARSLMATMAGLVTLLCTQFAHAEIRTAYVPAKSSQHGPIEANLRGNAVLEKVAAILAPFRWPKPLTLQVAGCDGEINAWFEKDTITVCYEYLQFIQETSLSRARPDWVDERAALIGPLVDVFLHEAAHAIFDYFEVPILGKEEDAADQVAGFAMLRLAGRDAPRLLAGITYAYLQEAGIKDFSALKRRRLRLVDGKALADAHSTPLQRMYNTLCLAYGSGNPDFRSIAEKGALPAERAEGCEGEYQQAERAFRLLILPHMDLDRLQALTAHGMGFRQ